MSPDRGPWIDLHGHAGRCFLAGLPAGHPMVASLGAASVADAVRDRGLPADRIRQILGGNAADLLHRTIP